jgi:transposase
MLVFGSQLADVRTDRCGVLPFTIINDKFYFLFPKHKSTQELCDFGGGIKKNETALSGGFREFLEESRNIFDITIDNLIHSIAWLNKKKTMALIFVHVDVSWYTNAGVKFHSVPSENLKKCSSEISDILWIDMATLHSIISSDDETMWYKLKFFFKNNIEIPKLSLYLRCVSDMNAWHNNA